MYAPARPRILPLMHPARSPPGGARQASVRPLLPHCYNPPKGESYCNDGLIQDCRAVKKRAGSGATTAIRIECGAGRVRRSLQRQRTGKEKDSPSLERQGPGRNPPGAKSAMGKGQGREEITGEGKVAPASLRLRSGQALPAVQPRLPRIGTRGDSRPRLSTLGAAGEALAARAAALREADHAASFGRPC